MILVPVLKLLSRNEVMDESYWRRYTRKPGKEFVVPSLKIIEPVNNRFAASSVYQKYGLSKQYSRYDEGVAHGLAKMAKIIAVLMNERTYSGKQPVSVIYFLQRVHIGL